MFSMKPSSVLQMTITLAMLSALGACDYEMHTHDGSGVVHIETHKERNFTLAQFFAGGASPWARARSPACRAPRLST
ncbi:hypothetical protein [Massilia sp. 9096]|uniref:hypothetical protein n=1 Tax=Massilia sp. 9096 TaxID=1500894 RepID=UPI00056C3D43|nr:hypothetical protein [Massilia sp. 9096]